MHPRAVAEIEPDRLQHLERRALGEDVGGCEHAGVLLDHGCGGRRNRVFEAALNAAQGLSGYLAKYGV